MCRYHWCRWLFQALSITELMRFFRNRRNRVLLIAAGLLAAWALTGFVLAPLIAQDQIGKRLGTALDRPVTVGRVEFNPFTLVLRIHDFAIGRTGDDAPAPEDGLLAAFELLEADLSWRSLYRFAPVVSSLHLQAPQVQVRRDEAGRLDIQDLIDRLGQPAPPEEKRETPPRFSVTNITIDEGHFVFDDAQLRERHEVREFALRIPFISSLPVDEEVHVEPSLHAVVDDARFELDGQALPFSPTRDSTLELKLEDLDLTRFIGYLPVPLPVELRSARLGTALTLVFSQAGNATPSIVLSGRAKLDGIDVREPGGTPLLTAEAIDADEISAAWPANRYTAERITIATPRISVARRTDAHRFLEPVLAAMERTQRITAAAGSRPVSMADSAVDEPAVAQSDADSSAGSPDAAGTPAADRPLKVGSEPAPRPASSTATITWQIGEITLEKGVVLFQDAQFEPRALQIEADGVEARIRDLTNDPATPANFELAFQLDHGEQIHLAGTSAWQKGEADAHLELTDVRPADWWWIAQPWLAVDVISGRLALQTELGIAAAQPDQSGPSIRLEQTALHLDDLVLRKRPEQRTLLKLPRFELADSAVDLAQRRIALGTLTTRGGQLLVQRDRDERFNIQRLLEPHASTAQEMSRGARRQTSADSGAAARTEGASRADASAAWTVTLGKLAVQDFAIDLQDQYDGRTVKLPISHLAVTVEDLSTATGAAPAKVSVQGRLGRRGALAVAGKAGLDPLLAQLQVAVRDLALAPLQSWAAGLSNAELASGMLSTEGSLHLAMAAKGSAATTSPELKWSGSAGIAGLSAGIRGSDEKLLNWKSLAIDKIAFDSTTMATDLGNITLDGLRARILLDPQGRLNLRALFSTADEAGNGVATEEPAGGEKNSADTAGAAVAPTAPVAADDTAAETGTGAATVRIGGVHLVDGDVDFSDFFIQPNYSARLSALNGRISQLAAGQPGELELRGRVNQTGQLELNGQVDPLAHPMQLNLAAKVDDVDLPGLSPYSGKYVGYGIEKGKLSAQLSYRLENRELTAENHVILDQLTFGKPVDSPDALELPVLFAVSLLKDRNGIIDVKLPISGSLDDPQFSISGIVLRIIGNLILKTVTAPFALIGNLVGGGGAELSWIGFAAGSAVLDEAAVGKLKTIATALTDRPGLKLDLAGHVDPASDREGLRQRALQQAVAAQRRGAARRNQAEGGSDDVAAIDPEKYPEYLERAWKAAKFDKPRNAIGLVKKQPVAEMERMMLEHIEVSDGDLLALGSERAQQVKDWLVETGNIPGERIFIVAAGENEKKDGSAQSHRGESPNAADDAPAPPAGTAAAAASPPPPARVDLSLK